MNCDDIRQKLKPFLEELLAEEEYREFCEHLNACKKCLAYVRSIGSLSNQLWKLGQVEVPQDLSSTIQYKLAHPEEKAQPVKTKITKKQIVAGIIVIISIIVLMLGINYFKARQDSLNEDDAPIVRTEIIRTIELPNDSETKALLNQPETTAPEPGKESP